MENIDVDTIPVAELFEMTRELAIYIQASQAESSTWDLAPNVHFFLFLTFSPSTSVCLHDAHDARDAHTHTHNTPHLAGVSAGYDGE
jgi:hypothetical protein